MDTSTLAIVLIFLFFLLVLILSGMPIGISLAVVGFIGIFFLRGWNAAVGALLLKSWDMTSNYHLGTVLMFVLMGHFSLLAGIADDVYRAMRLWFSRIPGSLAVATVGACALFGAASGSSVAATMFMGKIAVPEMKKYNYDLSIATGSVAGGGPLASLIPPSILMVIYGVMTETSIGKVLIAGIIPGILTALLFILMIVIRSMLNPNLCPAVPYRVTWMDRIKSLRGLWAVIFLFLLIMVGIYCGIFTPTEAGAIGAFGAFILFFIKRYKSLNLMHVLFETLGLVGSLFIIIIGASVFAIFIGLSGAPREVCELFGQYKGNAYLVMGMVTLLYLFLGTFLDALALMLLTIPIVFPLITELGYDPVWFGVAVIVFTEIGLITPPVGMSVYVLKMTVPDVDIGTMFRGVSWFFFVDLIVVVLLIFFPEIALWLPNCMFELK